MSKKVLITGGYGFIGSSLAQKCVELGMEVTIIDNLDTGSGGNIFNVQNIKDKIEIINGDITDVNVLKGAIHKKDFIFNCAASTSHTLSMKQPLLNLQTNCKTVINILELIRNLDLKSKLIHLSTTTQLGKLIYRPADENHPEFPTDIYSANKMASEKYVLLYSRSFNINAIVLRLSNVYGPRAAIHSPNFTFNNYFIGQALQNKGVTVFKPGNQIRNSIFIDDVINAMIKGATTNLKPNIFQIVHDQHFTVKEIAEMTIEIFGGKLSLLDWPEEKLKIEIGDALLSNEKAKKYLNWSPKISIKKGLKLTKAYYEKYLYKYVIE